MAALVGERDTKKLAGDGPSIEVMEIPQKGGTVLYAGAQTCIDTNKFAQPGVEATGLTAIGRCEQTSDAIKLADGVAKVVVRAGVFKWLNNFENLVGDTVDKVGAVCYVLDDQSVVKTDGGGKRSVAGVVHRIDSDGVYVLQVFPTA